MGWVSFRAKLGEKRLSAITNHESRKIESFGYSFIADTMNLA